MGGALTPNAGEADRAVNVQPPDRHLRQRPAEPEIPGVDATAGDAGAVFDHRISTARDDKSLRQAPKSCRSRPGKHEQVEASGLNAGFEDHPALA